MFDIKKFTIITGLMSSGKTSILMKNIEDDKGSIVVITGSKKGIIESRGRKETIIATKDEDIKESDSLYIDEVHMIDIEKIYSIIDSVRPKNIYIAGLSEGVSGNTFNNIHTLIRKYDSICEEFTIKYLNIICEKSGCSSVATTHIRESDSKETIQEDKNIYSSVCYGCEIKGV